jgi:hypothetical protein
MPQYRVSLGFARLPDQELDNFAQTVIDSMTGNAAYPTPPVAIAALTTAKNDFTDKIAAASTGGPMDTAAKNSSRQALIGLLRQVANYVQGAMSNDLTKLLSSGFTNASTDRVSKPLDTPTNLVLDNDGTGALVASVKPVKNTSLYEGRIKGPTGDWLPSVFTGDSKHIRFEGLTPGTSYTAQVRALGGSTGQSDWSDPSTHMSM